jgi:hypothetical protein
MADFGLIQLHDIHGKDEHWVNTTHIVSIREFKTGAKKDCLEIRTALNKMFYFHGSLYEFQGSTRGAFVRCWRT